MTRFSLIAILILAMEFADELKPFCRSRIDDSYSRLVGWEFFVFQRVLKGISVKSYFIVFLGGGLGAALRYWLSGAVYRFFPVDFPYGTLAVNLSGCFLIGILMAVQEGRFEFDPTFRLLIGIGILGGFTTFSTFSYETAALLRDGQAIQASVNILVSLFGCLAATVAGITIGKIA